MTSALGGPGVACSALRIRRLAAGELRGDERARTEAHLAACARCREVDRELGAERARLESDLPFEAFAAGVAERLARAPSRRPSRRWVGVALAAGLALAAAVPAVLRVAEERSPIRTKGGADVTVYVRDDGGSRALAPGDPVPAHGALRVALAPGGRRFAAVALVDADGAAVLYVGAAAPGLLAGAFEWTGAGEGTLVAVLDDVPIDPAALGERLARGGPAAASPRREAEVVVRPLRRAER